MKPVQEFQTLIHKPFRSMSYRQWVELTVLGTAVFCVPGGSVILGVGLWAHFKA